MRSKGGYPEFIIAQEYPLVISWRAVSLTGLVIFWLNIFFVPPYVDYSTLIMYL